MATTTWALEPTHSEVTFKVRHMMISNVTGRFTKFTSTVETNDEDVATANANFTIEVDSITTGNDQRDGHLKSEDFFDAANHPAITFKSTGMTKDGDDYKMTGDLTIRNTTKSVTLNVEFGGLLKDPWGYTRAGFTVTGKINRKDFGLNWSMLTEAGGMVVSEEVKFEVHAEYVKA